MERLTYRDKDGFPMMKKRGGFKSGGVERLAAYEETGRTPEEVTALGKLFDYALEESKTLTEQLALLNRIRDLAKADKDGRLVVLPCKVGDTVYILRRTFDGADVVGEAELWWDDIPQLGKTVFMTREEAEKALEAMKNGNG
nr:MAG TPA: hypothetical protein [Caudoviricetes sp.]